MDTHVARMEGLRGGMKRNGSRALVGSRTKKKSDSVLGADTRISNPGKTKQNEFSNTKCAGVKVMKKCVHKFVYNRVVGTYVATCCCVRAQQSQVEPLRRDGLEGTVSKMKFTLRRGGEKAERKVKD